MIYSCAMFFNEWPLLALRLAEELPVVDRLILVEATQTFSGRPKRLELTETACHLPEEVEILTVRFQDRDPWINESAQRNAPRRAFADEDVIVVSDMDEIHRREDLPKIIDAARRHGLVRIVQRNHYYRLNFVSTGERASIAMSLAVSGRYLRETGASFQALRRAGHLGERILTHGHHFDYLASPEQIAAKIQAFSHQEYNCWPYTDPAYIAQVIAEGRDLFDRWPGRVWVPEPLDETYPQAILENPEAWRSWMV